LWRTEKRSDTREEPDRGKEGEFLVEYVLLLQEETGEGRVDGLRRGGTVGEREGNRKLKGEKNGPRWMKRWRGWWYYDGKWSYYADGFIEKAYDITVL
jgi:hypothetical protein